jgi:glycerol uptake facilitator-like aquaporin
MNKNYLVEFLGTMIFFFMIFATFNYLAICLTLLIILYFYNNANLNPAVSIMLVFANKLHSYELIPYIIAQLTGGFLGYELSKNYGGLIQNFISFDKNLYQMLV